MTRLDDETTKEARANANLVRERIMDGDPDFLPYFIPKCPDSAHLPHILKSPRIKNFYTKSIGKHRTLTWFVASGGPRDGVLCLSVNTTYVTLELFILPSQSQNDTLDRIRVDKDMLRSANIFFDDVKAIAGHDIVEEKTYYKPHEPFTITTPDRILPAAIDAFINDEEMPPMVKTRYGDFAVSFQQSMDDGEWYVLFGLDKRNKWNLQVSIDHKSFFDMLGFPYNTYNMLHSIFTPNATKARISLASYLLNYIGIESDFIINHIMGLHNKISVDDYTHKPEEPQPVKRFDFEEYDEWADIKIRSKGEVEVYVGSCIMTLVSADR